MSANVIGNRLGHVNGLLATKLYANHASEAADLKASERIAEALAGDVPS